MTPSSPLRLASTFILLATPLAGCAGSETGNPQTTVETQMSVGLVPLPTIIPQPSIDGGQLHLASLAFEAADACGDASAALETLAAPVNFGLATSAPVVLAVVAGDYCGLHVGLEPVDGVSMQLTGALPDDTLFEITSGASLAAALTEPGTSFQLSAEAAPVLLSVDFTALVAGVDLASLSADTDGVIRVDGSHHSEQLAVVEGNLERALVLYRDNDGDGLLSKDEREAGPLAAAP